MFLLVAWLVHFSLTDFLNIYCICRWHDNTCFHSFHSKRLKRVQLQVNSSHPNSLSLNQNSRNVQLPSLGATYQLVLFKSEYSPIFYLSIQGWLPEWLVRCIHDAAKSIWFPQFPKLSPECSAIKIVITDFSSIFLSWSTCLMPTASHIFYTNNPPFTGGLKHVTKSWAIVHQIRVVGCSPLREFRWNI